MVYRSAHKATAKNKNITKKAQKKLSKKDLDRLQRFYAEAFERYGVGDGRSVQWTSDSVEQNRRFDILLDIVNHQNATILDVGCGLGDLIPFLEKKNLHLDYTGIDIVPKYIEASRARFPEKMFFEKSIFEVGQTFDYIVASGAMTFKVENNKSYYFAMIEKMYSLARKSVAFNMVSKKNHIDNETYATYHPEEVIDFCKSIADDAELIEGYLPQDFTIYLFKKTTT